MTARLTVMTSIRPRVLSKSAQRDEDGSIKIRGGGLLVEGDARIVTVDTLTDLSALLVQLSAAQALIHGIPRHGDGRVLSRGAFGRLGRPAGSTTRTRDQFIWPDGPGILMIDHDPCREALGRDDLVGLIREVAPGLADAAMLWLPSASSHICDSQTGEDLTGLRGQRLYIMVKDATDIPRAGAVLVDRLWAAGHGRIEASAAGSALERCPVDACVWQPERLDFAAGAICADDLEQRRGKPVLIAGSTEQVDTRLALPEDPKIVEAARTRRLQARREAKGILDAARTAYVERQVDTMVPASDEDAGDARASARATILRALDHSVLDADFPIDVATGQGSIETIPVGRVLANPQDLHGCLTRDPLEPGYDGGRLTGKLFLLDPRPTLFSFAHGGRSFRLIRTLQRIEIVKGRIAEATEHALQVLRGDATVFDFGGQVVVVERGEMAVLDEHSLAHHLGGLVQFWHWRTVAGSAQPQDLDPPARVVRQILSLGQRRRLKALSAIVTAPTLRPDGSVLASPGYDAETWLLFDAGDDVVPEIPAAPSGEQVAVALDRLMAPFSDFPFVDADARGGFLAALLTAAIRPSLPTAPAFAIDAPVQGSGKTLLASCIAALATGTRPEIWPHTAGRDDEEVRKRLFVALRTGTAALVWDNVTGILDSAAMAAAITAPVLRDHLLGRSESLSIPNRAMLLITGNNLCAAGDLPRRLIITRIDPGTDTPFARQFDLDPLDHVIDHRLDLVVACLTLIRGRLTSAAPRGPGRMASFETWDDLVRQTVAWIGTAVAPGYYGDPLDLVVRAQGSDPEQESLFGLLEALSDVFRDLWFTAKDVRERVQRRRDAYNATAGQSALEEAVVDIIGDRAIASTKSIGRMLKFREDRVVLGRRLVSRPLRNVREFRIETIKDPGTCRFGRFGRFESGGFEPESDVPPAGEDVGSESGTGDDSEAADSNRPNRPNRQTAEDPDDWRQR